MCFKLARAKRAKDRTLISARTSSRMCWWPFGKYGERDKFLEANLAKISGIGGGGSNFTRNLALNELGGEFNEWSSWEV